jgi:hypothetical protein
MEILANGPAKLEPAGVTGRASENASAAVSEMQKEVFQGPHPACTPPEGGSCGGGEFTRGADGGAKAANHGEGEIKRAAGAVGEAKSAAGADAEVRSAIGADTGKEQQMPPMTDIYKQNPAAKLNY